MNWKRDVLILLAMLALVFLIEFALVVWPTEYRYLSDTARKNRFTGQVEVRRGEGWEPAEGELRVDEQ